MFFLARVAVFAVGGKLPLSPSPAPERCLTKLWFPVNQIGQLIVPVSLEEQKQRMSEKTWNVLWNV